MIKEAKLNRQHKMASFKKKTLYNSGLILLTLFFICEGLSTMYLYQEEAIHLDSKLHNMEADWNNNYPSLSFRFKRILPFQNIAPGSVGTALSRMVMFTYGLATLVLGCLAFWFDEKRLRSLFIQILIALQMFYAFVLHLPFVEDKGMDSYTEEMERFIQSLMISSGLLMVVG